MIGKNSKSIMVTKAPIPVGGATSTGWNDDVLVNLGTDDDIAMLLRSATLNADTALAGVLIGTPDSHALSANSLIIANATSDGDILIAGNDGGTSRQFFYADVSVGNLYLGGMGKLTEPTGNFGYFLYSREETKP